MSNMLNNKQNPLRWPCDEKAISKEMALAPFGTFLIINLLILIYK